MHGIAVDTDVGHDVGAGHKTDRVGQRRDAGAGIGAGVGDALNLDGEQSPLFRSPVLAAEVEEYVAVVVTSGRAFGLSAKTWTFTEIRLRVRETIETIKITSSKATIRTSDRLLTFEASGSTWNERRLN